MRLAAMMSINKSSLQLDSVSAAGFGACTWFMPALANSSVGSLCGTTLLDGTMVCPFVAKKSKNVCRTRSPAGGQSPLWFREHQAVSNPGTHMIQRLSHAESVLTGKASAVELRCLQSECLEAHAS